MVSLRPGRALVAAQAPEDLPGSVPEARDEKPCPAIHNQQFGQYDDAAAGQTSNPPPYTHLQTHTHKTIKVCS